jgi:hypothetical protein
MQAWLGDPLVHFIVFGAALGALIPKDISAPPEGESVIEIDAGRLSSRYEAKYGRPPSATELDRLVTQNTERQILLREAKSLGLAEGDPIIERRLTQKLGFIIEDLAALEPPDEEAMARMLRDNPDAYRSPSQTSLVHMFTDPSLHEDAEAVARARLSGMNSGRALRGDPFIRGLELRAKSPEDLAKIFGPNMARALDAAPVGQWTGPLRSPYGWHAVKVTERAPSTVPGVGQARARLSRDWSEQKRQEARRETMARLRAKYDVRIVNQRAAR